MPIIHHQDTPLHIFGIWVLAISTITRQICQACAAKLSCCNMVVHLGNE